jgi:hypothetical protein
VPRAHIAASNIAAWRNSFLPSSFILLLFLGVLSLSYIKCCTAVSVGLHNPCTRKDSEMFSQSIHFLSLFAHLLLFSTRKIERVYIFSHENLKFAIV